MKKNGRLSWLVNGLVFAFLLAFASASLAATDVTSKVQLNKGRLLYDRINKQSYFDASLTNISQIVLLTPIKVVIDSVSPATITVANADGFTEDGKPYFEYTTDTGQIIPTGFSTNKSWRFANPTAAKFTYSSHIEGTLPKAEGLIGSTGGVVESSDGEKIEIAPGSLSSQERITISSVPPEITDNTHTTDNSQSLGSIDFRPNGLTFSVPAKVTFPLRVYVPPGETLDIATYNGITGEFDEDGVSCTVNADGYSCSGEITHFCQKAVLKKDKLVNQLWNIPGKHDYIRRKGYEGEYAYFYNGHRLSNNGRNQQIGGYVPPCSECRPPFAIDDVAVKLYSAIPEPEGPLAASKVPVLFVHGFNPTVFGFGGGYSTWGYFRELVNNINEANSYIPFEFQWKTDARFQDVAEDLAHAVETIYKKTGNKKVHIVAHSFGGIVTRTMLQKIFPDGSSWDISSYVASLTTLGTPHSGIADEFKILQGMTLPKGQDSSLFEGANQLSVHQMGESIIGVSIGACSSWSYAGIDCEEGEIAAALADDIQLYPGNVPTLIGIGLPTKNDEDVFFFRPGDGLITYEGQRFAPSLTTDGTISPLLNGLFGSIEKIKEVVLGYESVDPHPGEVDSVNPGSESGYNHNDMGDKKWWNKDRLEAFVLCQDDITCSHASFVNVKDWISTASDFDGDNSTPNQGDCNDHDAEINQNTMWYRDTDGDGYYDGTTVTQCQRSFYYYLPNELFSLEVDCDDEVSSVNPGIAENCADTIDNNCDGQVNEGCAVDSDNDGVDDTNDLCPDTPVGAVVDQNGCAFFQLYRLSDTGQTQSYTNTFGEDSDYTINPPSYTISADGLTVTDNNTGLEWQREDDNVIRNWTMAKKTCTDLILGGQYDWRLPTKKELMGIVDYDRRFPAIDTVVFPGTDSTGSYCTSTMHSSKSGWVFVYMTDGGVSYTSNGSCLVRCVRGDQ